ncbi:MAG TPA: peptidyl-prolyl cis-trans isomerase [Bacillus sp. (in: firmicutes)]|nr:peptidyl-prolyl cis-trans isomerase [Bacillus sp. (in: firmicutes)]
MPKSLSAFVIIGLLFTNCLTIAFFSYKNLSAEPVMQQGETVAKVGDVEITREEWMNRLEQQYGKMTLKDLINDKVIDQLAEEYDIEVDEEEVTRESTYFNTMYGMNPSENFSEDEWKDEIKRVIILEELLTKDVTIPEEDMQRYYEENQHLFTVPDTYHLAHILVKTEEEAKQTIEELEGGSSFAVLAMERSLDEFTSSQGGSLGFVSLKNHTIPTAYEDVLAEMEPETWSDPIKLEKEYAILYLHEKIEGQSWGYEEVKDQIRRKIALEQIETPISASEFWDDLEVEWFYGEQR